MALLEGTFLRGKRYQIRRLLARGGFGFVYLADDLLARRQVVLKELLPTLVSDPESMQRFAREGRVLQRLAHPNIVRSDGMFREQGNLYMVLEHVDGGVLSDWTDRGRKLSLSETARVAVALCDALSYIHQMGVVHCDLNPSNVLLGTKGEVKVSDLGIAHIADDLVPRHWRTQQSIAVGTLMYMPPEQIDGVRDDPRVDLYALAAMIYQMLSGRHHLDFELQNTPAAYVNNVQMVRNQQPTPVPEAPPEVERVLLRALAKDRKERYANVVAFCQAFVQAVYPYLPVEEGLSLVTPFRPVGQSSLRRAEPVDWPGWTWKALLAANVAVMCVVALLLFQSCY